MKKKTKDFEQSATAELARRLDIELEYLDAAGKRIVIAPEVVRAMLAAMGYRVEDDDDAQRILNGLDTNESSRKIPPVLVVRQDLQPTQIPVHLESGRSHPWRLLLEDGGIGEQGNFLQSAASNRREKNARSLASQIVLTVRLPCGYHRFELDDETMSLIVVPEKCWLDPIADGQKLWGIAAQLYLLKSEHNWGIGDFTDLCTLIEIAAGWGASLIGLNPLHALFVDQPEHASPYAPASRLYLNILNIDVTAIPEFATCTDAQGLLSREDFAATLAEVRGENMVDYKRAAELKLQMLRLLYSHFIRAANLERRQTLRSFVQQRGESLQRFCVFQTIRLHLARNNRVADDWQEWPQELRQADSPAVDAFAENHREEIDFFTWAQWIADTQFNHAAHRATALQMAVGLYRDVAIGSSAAGAETWSNPQVAVAGAHAGAPPDIVNPAGQNWGLPPFNPRTLRESAYTPFIELVRANMRYCGALRIDHVVGLQHLYWVPAGHKPDQGAYVTYPFDELAGILALESQRNQCLVIGEDLGTVPPGFSDKLNSYGILSYRVLYFEQNNESGEFIAPDQYRRHALATIGSHDLATLKGWWLGNDINIRERHHLYPDPQEAIRQRRMREKERQQLLVALGNQHLHPGDTDDFYSLSRSVHCFLARSKAAIAMVELDNLTAEETQTNLPATSREHPNWRRRLSKTLENLRNDANIASIIAAIQRERPQRIRT